MKKSILFAALVFSTTMSLLAQENTTFLQTQILGKGVNPAPMQLSLDVYPFFFLSNGGGGSASVEFSNWQTGIIGFSVAPPDFSTKTFFNNINNIKVKRNNAVEVFANYYLRKDRKGIYAGILGGPEWFMMQDIKSGMQETIIKNYIVPRLGVRVFPFKKYLYADASFGWSFNLSGTEQHTLGQTTYSATGGGFIYFLQLGARFNLAKN